MAAQREEQKKNGESKIFADPVHGLIEMDPLCVKIIDTPEFQRLRSIKQLSTCYSVYPGASHNRFEHSLGVCYLTGKFVEELQQRQSELEINDKDILCVKIAGLCHDLGHGPFSHLFDTAIVSKALEDDKKHNCFRHHEERSRLVLEHLIKKHDLKQAFTDRGLDDDEINFIGEIITASLDEKECPAKKSKRGQNWEKKFLFEIVANETSGIDVDKWDYFARDCSMVGMKNDFDHIRCMKLARVIKTGDKKRQICFRDKEVFNLYEMFHTRFILHTRVCQHHTHQILEKMVADVLLEADEHLLFGKKKKTMSTIIRDNDRDAFCLLTDEILSYIWVSPDSSLDPAREILTKIKARNLYKRIGKTRLTLEQSKKFQDDEEIKKDIAENLGNGKEIEVVFGTKDYGKKNENPVDNVRFYGKFDVNKTFNIPRETVSYLLPEVMYEKLIIVCYKGDDKSVENLKKLEEKFEGWCKSKGYPFLPKFKESNSKENDRQ